MSCRGCLFSGFCDTQMNGTTKDCPCEKCLVKVTCSEICKEYNNFYQTVFPFDHEEFKK